MARSRTIVPTAWPVWPLSLLTGVAASGLRSHQLALAPAIACPGLTELAAGLFVRAAPLVPIGTLLVWGDALSAVVAVALLVQFANNTGTPLVVAAAAGLALGVGPAFPVLVALPHVSLAVAATYLVGLVAAPRADGTCRRAWAIGLAVVPLVALLVPLGGGTCVTEGWDNVAGRLASVATALVTMTGPFVIALAGLAVLLRASAVSVPRFWRPFAVMALFAILSLASRFDMNVAVAPLLAVTWWLAALGLGDVTTLTRSGVARGLATGFLVFLVVWLQMARTDSIVDDQQVRGLGHEAMTGQRFRRMLDLVPGDAVIVAEDATTDVLLRAYADRLRASGKHVMVVPRNRRDVAAAAERTTVLALPLARRVLESQGVHFERFGVSPTRLDTPLAETPPGFARVAAIAPCVSMTSTWANLSPVLTSDRLALAADSATARGPAVLYLGANARLDVVPVDWPPRVLRGFHLRVFDQSSAVDRRELAVVARDDGLPVEAGVLKHAFVARVVLLRTPGAPLTLPVQLVGRVVSGIARRQRVAPAGGEVTICPSR